MFFLIVIIGPIIGFLYINFFSILLGVTGNWLGGTATINQISRTLPYATLPSVIGIFYVMLSIVLCGFHVFTDVENLAQHYSPVISIFVGLLFVFKGVLSIWTLVLVIIV